MERDQKCQANIRNPLSLYPISNGTELCLSKQDMDTQGIGDQDQY